MLMLSHATLVNWKCWPIVISALLFGNSEDKKKEYVERLALIQHDDSLLTNGNMISCEYPVGKKYR